MSADISQELEKIIKELIAKYYSIFLEWCDYKLFYKIGGKIYREDTDEGCYNFPLSDIQRYICRLRNLVRKIRQLAIDNPEYVLHVCSRRVLLLDFTISFCIKYADSISSVVDPLIPDALQPVLTPHNMVISRFIFDTDPLTQVLDYATLKLGTQSPPHSYVCPKMYYVEYPLGDLGYLSMGSAERGVVAYCTTFGNYMRKILSGQWELLNKELGSLRDRISTKLEEYNKQISSSSKEERKKYCDTYAVKDLVSKEIEEANRLMQKYGIIRVTVPLD